MRLMDFFFTFCWVSRVHVSFFLYIDACALILFCLSCVGEEKSGVNVVICFQRLKKKD